MNKRILIILLIVRFGNIYGQDKIISSISIEGYWGNNISVYSELSGRVEQFPRRELGLTGGFGISGQTNIKDKVGISLGLAFKVIGERGVVIGGQIIQPYRNEFTFWQIPIILDLPVLRGGNSQLSVLCGGIFTFQGEKEVIKEGVNSVESLRASFIKANDWIPSPILGIGYSFLLGNNLTLTFSWNYLLGFNQGKTVNVSYENFQISNQDYDFSYKIRNDNLYFVISCRFNL